MTTKASPLLIDTGNITSVGTLTSLTVSGTLTGNVTGAANTVTDAVQANITSVGTLSSLTINGNATLGGIANVHISGGTSGQFISTDGAGNLSFTSVSVPVSTPHPFIFLGI